MTNATPIQPAFACLTISVEAEPAWTPNRPPYVLLVTRDSIDDHVLGRSRLAAEQARQLAQQLLAIADQVEEVER